jgi:hypothetical protein
MLSENDDPAGPVTPTPFVASTTCQRTYGENRARQMADQQIPWFHRQGALGHGLMGHWHALTDHQWHMLPLLFAECAGSPDKMWFYDRFVAFMKASDYRDDVCHARLPRNPRCPVLVEAILMMMPAFSCMMSRPRVPSLDFDALAGAGNWQWRPTQYENPHGSMLEYEVVDVPIPLTPHAFAIFRLVDWGNGEW